MRAAFLSFIMLSALAMSGAGLYAAGPAGEREAINGYGINAVAE